jgi:hypothetical protein
LSCSYDWWCEPIKFYRDLTEDGRLQGFTKVSRGRLTTLKGDTKIEVDAKDNNIMTWRDIYQIVNCLYIWANRYKITWHLDFYGTEMGLIRPDGVSKEVDNFLEDWIKEFGLTMNDFDGINSKYRTINAKYANRE